MKIAKTTYSRIHVAFRYPSKIYGFQIAQNGSNIQVYYIRTFQTNCHAPPPPFMYMCMVFIFPMTTEVLSARSQDSLVSVGAYGYLPFVIRSRYSYHARSCKMTGSNPQSLGQRTASTSALPEHHILYDLLTRTFSQDDQISMNPRVPCAIDPNVPLAHCDFNVLQATVNPRIYQFVYIAWHVFARFVWRL